MKLSQINTNELCDVICELTEPIANITADQELFNVLKDTMGLNGKESMAEKMTVGAKKFTKLMPILLNDHRKDVFKILSIVNDKTIEEIEAQKGIETIKQAKEAFKDEELLELFK